MAYLADTNVINGLVNGTIRIKDLPSDRPLIAPRASIEKIKTTQDKARRSELLLKFKEHQPKRVSIGSVMLDGTSGKDFTLRDGELFQKLKDEAHRLGDSVTNMRDILMAELAITNGLILLTANQCLADVVSSLGGEAVLFPGS